MFLVENSQIPFSIETNLRIWKNFNMQSDDLIRLDAFKLRFHFRIFQGIVTLLYMGIQFIQLI